MVLYCKMKRFVNDYGLSISRERLDIRNAIFR